MANITLLDIGLPRGQRRGQPPRTGTRRGRLWKIYIYVLFDQMLLFVMVLWLCGCCGCLCGKDTAEGACGGLPGALASLISAIVKLLDNIINYLILITQYIILTHNMNCLLPFLTASSPRRAFWEPAPARRGTR